MSTFNPVNDAAQIAAQMSEPEFDSWRDAEGLDYWDHLVKHYGYDAARATWNLACQLFDQWNAEEPLD